VFLPLGTDRPLKRPTRVTHALIGLNVAVFLGQALLTRFAPDLAARLDPELVLRGADFKVWTLVTYQFVHAGFWHIAGNMLFLYVFGPNLEDRLGRWWFLLFYLAGGAAAGGVHAVWSPAVGIVGASGAVSAVTGAFLVFFPRTIVRVFILFFVIGVIHIPAMWFIGFQIFLNVFYQGMGGDGRVAYLAHLAGYAYGFAVAYALLATGAMPREVYDLFSMGKQARRRRQFRELTSRGHDPWGGRPKGARGPRIEEKPDPKAEALAQRRAEISRAIAEKRLDEGLDRYGRLVEEFGAPALPRDAHLTLANHAFSVGRHEDAARLYEAFLAARPKDAEAPHVRLMLALVRARYLDKPDEARPLLSGLDRALRDPEHSALARALAAEVGEAPP